MIIRGKAVGHLLKLPTIPKPNFQCLWRFGIPLCHDKTGAAILRKVIKTKRMFLINYWPFIRNAYCPLVDIPACNIAAWISNYEKVVEVDGSKVAPLLVSKDTRGNIFIAESLNS